MLGTSLTIQAQEQSTSPDYSVLAIKNFQPEHAMTLWYNKPATLTGVSNIWMEYSLPIGNGYLGASLYGGIKKDEIQFNEKTLWTGGPSDLGDYGHYRNFGSVLVEDLSGTFGNTSEKAHQDQPRHKIRALPRHRRRNGRCELQKSRPSYAV